MIGRKSILVTGGAGFLGSHLCGRLVDGGDVICIDNFFTGRKQSLEHLLGQSRFELMRHDVTFPLYVEVDQIYDLAGWERKIEYFHRELPVAHPPPAPSRPRSRPGRPPHPRLSTSHSKNGKGARRA
jgi:nucleoside-diphosphate-sugar epimerase